MYKGLLENFRPEVFKYAAQQMRNIPPDEIVNMSLRVAQASPEELAIMKQFYVLQGSQNLKNQVCCLSVQVVFCSDLIFCG